MKVAIYTMMVSGWEPREGKEDQKMQMEISLDFG